IKHPAILLTLSSFLAGDLVDRITGDHQAHKGPLPAFIIYNAAESITQADDLRVAQVSPFFRDMPSTFESPGDDRHGLDEVNEVGFDIDLPVFPGFLDSDFQGKGQVKHVLRFLDVVQFCLNVHSYDLRFDNNLMRRRQPW